MFVRTWARHLSWLAAKQMSGKKPSTGSDPGRTPPPAVSSGKSSQSPHKRSFTSTSHAVLEHASLCDSGADARETDGRKYSPKQTMLQKNCRIRSLTRTIGGLCFWSKRFKICVNPADSVERRVEPVDSCGHLVSLCTSCTNDKLSKDGRQKRCQRMKNDQVHFFFLVTVAATQGGNDEISQTTPASFASRTWFD